MNNKSQLGVLLVSNVSPDSVSSDIYDMTTETCVRCREATSEMPYIDRDTSKINLPSHLSDAESQELRVLLTKYSVHLHWASQS